MLRYAQAQLSFYWRNLNLKDQGVFSSTPGSLYGNSVGIQAWLINSGIRLESEKIGGLKPGVPEAMSERARKHLSEYESILPNQQSVYNDGEKDGTSGPWLFGLANPSALDAHLIVFVARMRDIGRSNIVPNAVSDYVDRAMRQPKWQTMMEGRKTMIGV